MRLAPGLLRLKLALVSDGRRVAVALLLVAVLALGAAAFTAANPPQQTVTEQRHPQTVETDLESSAVVTGETSLYERGTRLEAMPVYLRSATPNATLHLRTALPTSTGDDSEIRLTQRVWLTYTAEHDGEVFWQDRQPLGEQTVRRPEKTATATSENVTLETQLHVDRVADRLRAIRADTGQAGQLSVTVHSRVEYETGRYEGNLSASAPLELTEQVYWFSDDVTAENTHTTPVEVRRVDERRVSTATLPGLGQVAIPHRSTLLGTGGLACLLVAGWIRLFRRRHPGEVVLRERLERERFDEWISRGRVPTDAGEQTVDVASLADLVDVAIDADKRVICDSDRELYVVIDGDVVYRYRQRAELEPFVRKSPVEGD